MNKILASAGDSELLLSSYGATGCNLPGLFMDRAAVLKQYDKSSGNRPLSAFCL